MLTTFTRRILAAAAACLAVAAAFPGAAAASTPSERSGAGAVSQPPLVVENNAGTKVLNTAVSRMQVATSRYVKASVLFARPCAPTTQSRSGSSRAAALAAMTSGDANVAAAMGLARTATAAHNLRFALLKQQGRDAVDGVLWLEAQSQWQVAQAEMQVSRTKALDAARACPTPLPPVVPTPR